MRSNLDCIACFVRQTTNLARRTTDDPVLQRKMVMVTIEVLQDVPPDVSPPYISDVVYKRLEELVGSEDLFIEEKERSNAAALDMMDDLRKMKDGADDPEMLVTRFALAGNIIDLGSQDSYDLDATLDKVLGKAPRIDDTDKLWDRLLSAEHVIYLADNAGEIVFDTLFIEHLLGLNPKVEVQVWVKAEPILNDAMEKDAEDAGLDRMDRVSIEKVGIRPGSDPPLADAPEFIQRYKEVDLVISKGQANYELLSEHEFIAFLLMAKCIHVANDLGVELGDSVVKLPGR